MKSKSIAFSFDTITLEGSLFVADLLEKAALGLASRQTAADYAVPRGLRLGDEYGRAFQIAGAIWAKFESDTATHAGREAAHTKAFMTEFFRDALGYHDIRDTMPQTIGERTWPAMQEASPGIPLIACPWNLPLDKADSHFAVTGEGTHKKSAFALAQGYLNASSDRDWAFVTNGLSIRLIRDSDSLVRPAYLEFDLATIMREQRFPDFCAMWRILHESRAKASIWDLWRAEGLESGTRVRDGLRNGVTRALIELGSGFLKPETPANRELHDAINSGTLSISEYYRELLRLVYRFLFLFTIEERGLLHTQGDAEGNIDPALRKAQNLYHSGYSMARLRDRALRASAFDRNADLWEGLRVVFRSLQTGEAKLDLPALGGIFGADQCPHLEGILLPNNALLSAMRNLRWAAVDGSRTLIDYKNMDTEEFGSVYESLLELVPVVDLASRSFGFVGVDAEAGSTAGNARKTTGSYYTPDSLVRELIKSALDPVIKEKLGASAARGARPTGLSAPREKEPGGSFSHSASIPGPEEALLSIAVIDPACGSGHFLLAAARHLAQTLAELRAEGTPDGAARGGEFRRALREVIAHCIYGVDLNPMAVELARTALWLEGYEPGKPLGFLDHHVRCGNSLVGVTSFDVLKEGIPDDAYAALTGDDKATAKALKKRNADEKKAKGQMDLFGSPLANAEASLYTLHHKLDAIDSESLESIAKKKAVFEELIQSDAYRQARLSCDLWTSAFFIPKKPGTPVPTSADVRAATEGSAESAFQQGARDASRAAAEEARFFHWPLEFPEVFQRHNPGFDCVLGNPPWERVKLQEEEFFAPRDPEISNAKNKSERDRLIDALKSSANPSERALHADFETAKHVAEATSVFAHVSGTDSGRYPLTGVGDVNTYALFAELILFLRSKYGRAGFITPSGIATDDSTKKYFAHISLGKLASFYDFENRDALFPGVHRSFKFALQTLGAAGITDFAFFLTDPDQLPDERRHFTLRADEFALINPNTRTCPVFRSARDAEITKKVYSRVPVLIREAETNAAGSVTRPEENPWGITFQTMFHMSNDSGLFRDAPSHDSLPLYEAKMIHQMDHRWSTYEAGLSPRPASPARAIADDDDSASSVPVRDVTEEEKVNPEFSVRPRYWVSRREVLARIARAPSAVIKPWLAGDSAALASALRSLSESDEADSLADLIAIASLPAGSDLLDATEATLDKRSPKWLMGWRDITNATNERTVIASVVPRAGVGNNLPLMLYDASISTVQAACLLADLDSIVTDFFARHKVGGTHLNFFIYKQLPVLPPSAYSPADIAFIVPRVFELTYTAYDMAGWAEDLWDSMDGSLRYASLLARHEAKNPDRTEPYYGPDAASLEGAPWEPARFPPFPWNPARRARLRAELDARYARLYGLTRDELRYILDPASIMGDDYPSETFRVLKNNELRDYGEYRTEHLVLEAWDREEGR
jgi:hypothetical protein